MRRNLLYFAVLVSALIALHARPSHGAALNAGAPPTACQGATAEREAALHQAIEAGREADVRSLLQGGADPQSPTPQGETPLHLAAAGGHRAIAEALVQAGADVNAPRSRDARRPLHIAVDRADIALARFLIQHGADVRSAGGETPLHIVMYHRNEGPRPAELAALLLEAGADPNARTNSGWTPLHAAAGNGFLEHVRILLAHGADPNAPSHRGLITRPLDVALDSDRIEVASLLIASGARVRVEPGTWTPLHTAARSSGAARPPVAALQMLFDAGAEVNARDEDGQTALYVAVRQGRPDQVRALLEHGADPNLQRTTAADDGLAGMTPLHAISALLTYRLHEGQPAEYLSKAEMLFAAGANPNLADSEGKTPLHYFAQGFVLNYNGQMRPAREPARPPPNREWLEMLLRNHADINVRDAHSRTPLVLARENGNRAAARMLESVVGAAR